MKRPLAPMVIGLSLTLAVALAGCGSGSKGNAATSSNAAATTSSATPTAAAGPLDGIWEATITKADATKALTAAGMADKVAEAVGNKTNSDDWPTDSQILQLRIGGGHLFMVRPEDATAIDEEPVKVDGATVTFLNYGGGMTFAYTVNGDTLRLTYAGDDTIHDAPWARMWYTSVPWTKKK